METRFIGSILVLCGATACASPPAAPRGPALDSSTPEPGTGASPKGDSRHGLAEGVSEEYCARITARRNEPVCVATIDLAQVKHRPLSYRLLRSGGRVIQKDRINGLLEFEPAAGEVAREVYEYEGDQVVGLKRYDRLGRLLYHDAIDEQGVYWWRFAEGELDGDDPGEAQGVRVTFNEQGFEISETHLGFDGRPVGSSNGFERIDSVVDKRGAVLEHRYFASNGDPSFDTSGAHWLKYRRDRFGEVLETRIFDSNGEPSVDRSGVHLVRFDRNEYGVLVSQKNFSREGEPVQGWRGVHEERFTVNDHGQAVATTYFDGLGVPQLSAFGFHRYESEYDGHGNEITWKYFGLQGEPIGAWNRQHIVKKTFVGGLLVLEEMFGIDGERLKPWQYDYSSTKNTYDEHGRLVETAHLGPDGRPTDDKNGTCVTKNEWDHLGRLTRKTYFDANGGKAKENGYHERIVTYGDKGVPEFAYRDENGEPVRIVHHTKVVVHYNPHLTRDPPAPARRLIELFRPQSSRTKAQARLVVDKAVSDLKAGVDSTAVARRYGSPARSPGRDRSDRFIDALSELTPEDQERLGSLKPGEVSAVFDDEGEFVVYRVEAVY